MPGSAVGPQRGGHNIRLIISERFLSGLAQRPLSDTGPVRDFILGADVYGSQRTVGKTDLRLIPNGHSAALALELTGLSRSETQSYPRSQRGMVVICSTGRSRFVAWRPIYLTAEGIHAKPARIRVETSTVIQGGDTVFSWAPVMGGVLRSLAVRGAERKLPRARVIASSRLADEVLPRLTAKSDQLISSFNQTWKALRDPLTEQGLFPTSLATRTTNTHLFVEGQIGPFDQRSTSSSRSRQFALSRSSEGLRASGHGFFQGVHNTSIPGVRTTLLQPTEGSRDRIPLDRSGMPGRIREGLSADSMAFFEIHGTAVEYALNRLELGGRTLNAEGFVQLLAGRLSQVRQLDSFFRGLSTVLPPEGSITFQETDPLEVRFMDGILQLRLRAAKFELGELQAPGHLVDVRYRIELEENHVRWVRVGEVDVKPFGRRSWAMERMVAEGLRMTLERKLFPAALNLPRTYQLSNAQGRPTTLQLAQASITDGWLSLTLIRR